MKEWADTIVNADLDHMVRQKAAFAFAAHSRQSPAALLEISIRAAKALASRLQCRIGTVKVPTALDDLCRKVFVEPTEQGATFEHVIGELLTETTAAQPRGIETETTTQATKDVNSFREIRDLANATIAADADADAVRVVTQ
jgi:hypothetical protein